MANFAHYVKTSTKPEVHGILHCCQITRGGKDKGQDGKKNRRQGKKGEETEDERKRRNGSFWA